MTHADAVKIIHELHIIFYMLTIIVGILAGIFALSVGK